jgi:hypothetical protein
MNDFNEDYYFSIIQYNGLYFGHTNNILSYSQQLYIDLYETVKYDNTNEAVHFLERFFHIFFCRLKM